jgi:hypothetical protein
VAGLHAQRQAGTGRGRDRAARAPQQNGRLDAGERVFGFARRGVHEGERQRHKGARLQHALVECLGVAKKVVQTAERAGRAAVLAQIRAQCVLGFRRSGGGG